MRLSLKLGALCAGAAAVPLVAAAVVVMQRMPAQQSEQPAAEVQAGSRTALVVYEKRLEQMRLAAQHLANEIGLKVLGEGSGSERVSGPKLARLQDLLSRARDELSLDFVVIADSRGQVIARHNDVPAAGETLVQSSSRNLLGAKVVADGSQLRTSPLAAIAVERGEQLTRLWLDKTARVSRADGSVIEDALVIEAAAPMFSSGQFTGAVLIGQMLNNYYVARPGATILQTPLVAEIKQTLFPGSDEGAGAVLALGDTVIASSVRDESATKPALLGASCHTSNAEEVLDWGTSRYRVSWQQIKGFDGSPMGAIGVAAPVVEPAIPAFAGMRLAGVIAAAGVVLALLVGLFAGRALASRVNSLSDAVTRMSVGELSTTVRDAMGLNGSTDSVRADEIGRLASHLDQMRESFRQAI